MQGFRARLAPTGRHRLTAERFEGVGDPYASVLLGARVRCLLGHGRLCRLLDRRMFLDKALHRDATALCNFSFDLTAISRHMGTIDCLGH